MGIFRRRKKNKAPKPPRPERNQERNMPFLGHLEELRWHVIRSLIAIIMAFVVIFSNIRWVMDNIILAVTDPAFPTYKLLCRLGGSFCPDEGIQIALIAITPTEQFTRALLISFIGGIVVMFPYIFWEVWRFVRPGLRSAEARRTRGLVFPVSLLFFTGLAFAYYIISPFSLLFFQNFNLMGGDAIENQWRIGSVVGFIMQISLAGALLFQMPVLAWVLARTGLLRPGFLKGKRRHAIVSILIIAAILTPADWVSQLALALPMWLLYEVSIIIVGRVHRRQMRRAAKAGTLEVMPPPPPPPAPAPDYPGPYDDLPPADDTPPPPSDEPPPPDAPNPRPPEHAQHR